MAGAAVAVGVTDMAPTEATTSVDLGVDVALGGLKTKDNCQYSEIKLIVFI